MSLVEPYGGKIVSLIGKKNIELKYTIIVDKITETNIYNLGEGVYSPLDSFMRKKDFDSVLENIELANGLIWPMPIVFSISKKQKEEIERNEIKNILLINKEGEEIAILKNEELYSYNKELYKQKVYGTTDISHPGVVLVNNMGDYLLGGVIKLLQKNSIKKSTIFGKYYLNPLETRDKFQKRKWSTVVAFQTRNPPHRSHEYLQKCALESIDGLFINPVIGEKNRRRKR